MSENGSSISLLQTLISFVTLVVSVLLAYLNKRYTKKSIIRSLYPNVDINLVKFTPPNYIAFKIDAFGEQRVKLDSATITFFKPIRSFRLWNGRISRRWFGSFYSVELNHFRNIEIKSKADEHFIFLKVVREESENVLGSNKSCSSTNFKILNVEPFYYKIHCILFDKPINIIRQFIHHTLGKTLKRNITNGPIYDILCNTYRCNNISSISVRSFYNAINLSVEKKTIELKEQPLSIRLFLYTGSRFNLKYNPKFKKNIINVNVTAAYTAGSHDSGYIWATKKFCLVPYGKPIPSPKHKSPLNNNVEDCPIVYEYCHFNMMPNQSKCRFKHTRKPLKSKNKHKIKISNGTFHQVKK